MAQLMPLPLTVSCFSKIQIGFTFLVPADPDSPGQRAVKRVCCIQTWCACLVAQARVVQSARRSDGVWKREVHMKSLLLWKLWEILLSKQLRGKVCRLFLLITENVSFLPPRVLALSVLSVNARTCPGKDILQIACPKFLVVYLSLVHFYFILWGTQNCSRWPSPFQVRYCTRQPNRRLFMFTLCYNVCHIVPSVLWRCWLGDRKGIWPLKNWVVGYWHGYLSGARCRLAYGPADATATHCLLLQ